MMLKNFDDLLSSLEKVELDSPDGVAPVHVYCQILAIYLYQNELCYAKYLWKRIPTPIKSNSTDLKNIWAVAQKMWQRDWHGVHTALNVEWNKHVAEIMNALKDRIRESAIVLISDAYSSLDISTLAKMTGLTQENAHQLAAERDWTVNGNIVNPKKICRQESSPIPETMTEDQLFKLTQFVSFLEN